MNNLAKRFGVDRWISEGAPVFWVVGLSMLFLGLTLRLLSVAFEFLEWRIPALVTFWALGILVVCFVACGIWFVYDALTASRPTPWRK